MLNRSAAHDWRNRRYSGIRLPVIKQNRRSARQACNIGRKRGCRANASAEDSCGRVGTVGEQRANYDCIATLQATTNRWRSQHFALPSNALRLFVRENVLGMGS